MADAEKEPESTDSKALSNHFIADHTEENTKKRRRNPSSDQSVAGASKLSAIDVSDGDDSKTDASIQAEKSKLTVQNVADHVKRCQEEEIIACKENVRVDDRCRAAETKPVCLDEVVDNFSTMATDGSVHSFCGSCDCDNQEVKGAAIEGSQNDLELQREPKGDGIVAGPVENETVAGPVENESSVVILEQCEAGSNNGLDADGNIIDPDEIGEPNEPLLGHWEAVRPRKSLVNRKMLLQPSAAMQETDQGSSQSSFGQGDGGDSSDYSSLRAASSIDGAMYYEARSPSVTVDRSGDSLGVDDFVHRPMSAEEDDTDEDRESGISGSPGDAVMEERPMPPHKWNAVKATRDRELGIPSTKSPDLFPHRANGSLHFVQRLELMYKMEEHEGCVNCLHFNESGTRLASGSDDLNVIIWDWTTSRSLITIETGHRANVFQAKFMPLSGDCHVVTCARDGQVRLAELSVRGICKSTRKLVQHRGAAHKLALEVEAPHTFLSCGEDAVVYELDLRDPKPNKMLVCKDAITRGRGESKVPLYSVHSHPRNSFYFAVSGRDPYCRLFDKRMILAGSEPVKKFCPQHLAGDQRNKANVTALVFNYDGTELLGTYNDDDIYLFETDSTNESEYKHRYKGHRNNATVKGVNFFGPASEFIVSGSDCGHVYFWEKESESVVQFMPGDEGGVVNCLEPHPTCAILATSGLDHDVKIWVPSCEEPKLDVKQLKKLMRKNERERVRERESDDNASFLDSQVLWYLMNRMRQSGRQGNREDDDSDASGGDNTDMDGSDRDEESGDGAGIQCRPS